MAETEVKYGEHELDVLIIGGGGAAALAALAVKREGLAVGLVTKESALVGGATIMAAGGTCAVFSPGDTPETFQSDILKSGGYLNNAKLVRRVTEQSAGGVLSVLLSAAFATRSPVLTMKGTSIASILSRLYLRSLDPIAICGICSFSIC